jgi:hypothetical protein
MVEQDTDKRRLMQSGDWQGYADQSQPSYRIEY